METLKYKVIKTREQYDAYCKALEALIFNDTPAESDADEIALITLLIKKYDEENVSYSRVAPIRLLKSLMEDHNLKSKDLAEILDVSKGLVSDILNYKKGLSKEVIRKLAGYFKLRQEAFNQPYELIKQHKDHTKRQREGAIKLEKV